MGGSLTVCTTFSCLIATGLMQVEIWSISMSRQLTKTHNCGSSNFMSGSSSWYVTTLTSLVVKGCSGEW